MTTLQTIYESVETFDNAIASTLNEENESIKDKMLDQIVSDWVILGKKHIIKDYVLFLREIASSLDDELIDETFALADHIESILSHA